MASPDCKITLLRTNSLVSRAISASRITDSAAISSSRDTFRLRMLDSIAFFWMAPNSPRTKVMSSMALSTRRMVSSAPCGVITFTSDRFLNPLALTTLRATVRVLTLLSATDTFCPALGPTWKTSEPWLTFTRPTGTCGSAGIGPL